jgi:hypothetical protein
METRLAKSTDGIRLSQTIMIHAPNRPGFPLQTLMTLHPRPFYHTHSQSFSLFVAAKRHLRLGQRDRRQTRFQELQSIAGIIEPTFLFFAICVFS